MQNKHSAISGKKSQEEVKVH